jgi:hypothetical protein
MVCDPLWGILKAKAVIIKHFFTLAAKNRLCRVGSAENFTTVNQALKAKRDEKLLFERFTRTGYIRQPFCSNISGRSFGTRKNDRFDSRGCGLYSIRISLDKSRSEKQANFLEL